MKLIVSLFCVGVYIESVWMLNQDDKGFETAIYQLNCTGTSNESANCSHVDSHGHVPPSSSTTSPRSSESRDLPECMEEEKSFAQCVAGQGTCFVYTIGQTRMFACHCMKKYTGHRCEEMNFNMMFNESKDKEALVTRISACIGAAIVVIVVLVIVFIVCHRRRSRRREKHTQQNGNTCIQQHRADSETVQQPLNGRTCNNKHNCMQGETTEMITEM